ncbi:MAG: shikimate dehydrogenase [Clostridiales bacterium]|jgi:shikimate dehydrogenase|nr:shikimate dehydrogenase [Clostridiales bacterium]
MDNNTKLLGVIGSPISHTLSPKIHNFIINKLGLNYCYLPFKIEGHELSAFFESARLLNIVGFNVTIPHKEAVYGMAGEVFGDAKESKSVNTVKLDGGIFKGYSTDSQGFTLSLKERGISFSGKNVLIIGAGGAARAIVIAACKQGAKSINVVNRGLPHAQKILEGLNNSSFYPLSDETLTELAKWNDIIINCTPLGMHGFNSDFSGFGFLNTSPKTVCDLIYSPLETRFLKNARQKGHVTINGMDMLIYQAILSLGVFTGISLFDENKAPTKLKNDIASSLK